MEGTMIGRRIALAFLALIIGAAGFVLLFLIGEGTGSGILAYAADTLIFALATYGLSRADPGGWLIYALLACAPVLLLSVGGASPREGALAVLMTVVAAGVGFVARANAVKEAPVPPENSSQNPSSQV